jgi:hypothetical protein
MYAIRQWISQRGRFSQRRRHEALRQAKRDVPAIGTLRRNVVLVAIVSLAPLWAGCSSDPPLSDEGKQRLREAEEREKKFEEETARKIEARKKRSPQEILSDDAAAKAKDATAEKSVAKPDNGSPKSPAKPEDAKNSDAKNSDAKRPDTKRPDANQPDTTKTSPDVDVPSAQRSPEKSRRAPPADHAVDGSVDGGKPSSVRDAPRRPFNPLNPKRAVPSPLDGGVVITIDEPPLESKGRNAGAATEPHAPASGGANSRDTVDMPPGTIKKGQTSGPPRAAWRRLRGGMPAAEVEKLLGAPTSTSSDAYVLYWYYGTGEAAGKVAFIGPSQQAIAWDAPLR